MSHGLKGKHRDSPLRYGIMGAGQLAWMLCLAAKKKGYYVTLIGAEAGDPASAHADEYFETHQLLTSSQKTELLRDCDIVTFESEFLDFRAWSDIFAKVSLSEGPALLLYPAIAVMEKLSDKWEQKILFQKAQLPTAPAQLVEDPHMVTLLPHNKWVAKWSRQGYDGYGNFFLSKMTDPTQWSEFWKKSQLKGARVYLEEEVAFEKECALIVARDIHGNFLHYPAFVTEQKSGICEWVWKCLDKKCQEALNELLPKFKDFLSGLNYVGVMAFEFFYLDGKVLLNEVAPRVHNSGHITLDAFNLSQFDLHVMAAEGFGDVQIIEKSENYAINYAMKNILGQKDFAVNKRAFVQEMKKAPAEKIYWYGKKESRVGRKMGHINVIFAEQSETELRNSVLEVETKFLESL